MNRLGHHGRRLASVRRGGARRAAHHRRAGDRQPFGPAPLHARLRAQHQRRARQGGRGERRRGADAVRQRLHRCRQPPTRRRTSGEAAQTARMPSQGRGQAGGATKPFDKQLAQGPSGAGDARRRGARPDRLCGQAGRRRPRRHRLGLRRRQRRAAGRAALGRRLPEPGRRPAGSAAIPMPTSARSSAATCCGCGGRSRRGAAK